MNDPRILHADALLEYLDRVEHGARNPQWGKTIRLALGAHIAALSQGLDIVRELAPFYCKSCDDGVVEPDQHHASLCPVAKARKLGIIKD